MGNLTDLKIKALVKADGDGLTFTLSAKGTAARVLRYRFGGKLREPTPGRYPGPNPDRPA